MPLAHAFLLRPCRLSTATVFVSTSVAAGIVGFLRSNGQALGFTGAASHLVGRIPYYSNQPSLLHDVAHVSVGRTAWRSSIGNAMTAGHVLQLSGIAHLQ